LLEVGGGVRLRCGPLAGTTGTLARFKRGRRTIVSVSFPGGPVEVEVDLNSIEVIDPVSTVSGNLISRQR